MKLEIVKIKEHIRNNLNNYNFTELYIDFLQKKIN